MAEALGSGWLTQLIVALVVGGGGIFAALRWVVKYWQRPVMELRHDKEKLIEQLEKEKEKYIEEMRTKTFYEIANDYCQSDNRSLRGQLERCQDELRQWRDGKRVPD